jgi:hypothetical protein
MRFPNEPLNLSRLNLVRRVDRVLDRFESPADKPGLPGYLPAAYLPGNGRIGLCMS